MASSVLLVYEGDTSDDIEQHVDLRLIDFDHTQIHEDGTARDTAGVIFGVRSLIRLLKKILFAEQMSRSETDVFNLRSARSVEEKYDDAGATTSAVEPSVFGERHLPFPKTATIPRKHVHTNQHIIDGFQDEENVLQFVENVVAEDNGEMPLSTPISITITNTHEKKHTRRKY